MQLQKFVTDVIEGLGGVVVPVEYALCQVLIPEEYKRYFQNKTELELSFDFEVAEENPQSEFVTFGSYILEQVLVIANQKAISTIRFAEVERLALANPLKKINEFLKDEPGRATIKNERPVLGVFAVFQFLIAYVSDEKEEKMEQIWIDMLTGERTVTMKQEQNRIIFKNEPIYTYSIPNEIHIGEGLNTAYQFVKIDAEYQRKHRLQENQLKKEFYRIESYYTELLMENEKRSNRKGLSEEKKQEIKAKSRAIELEKDKQLQEIKDKYNGQIEISLDHGILYFVPLLEYEIDIHFRSNCKEQTLYYNPITKQFTKIKSEM